MTDPNIVFRYSKKPSQNKRLVCKHRVVSHSLSHTLSLSLLLRPADADRLTAWSGANKYTKSYNLGRLCARWSRNISDKYLLSNASDGRIKRGDRGSRPPPLKNHKNIGFPSNIDPATKPAFNGGPLTRQQTPFQRRFTDGPMVVHF